MVNREYWELKRHGRSELLMNSGFLYMVSNPESLLDLRTFAQTWDAHRLHLCTLQSKTRSYRPPLITCVFGHEVWFNCLRKFGWQLLSLAADDAFPIWWLHRRKQVAKARRKAFNSLYALIAQCIWLHRNDSVFRNGTVSVARTLSDIDSHLDGWVSAGLDCRSQLLVE
jgi:hypothetical protein